MTKKHCSDVFTGAGAIWAWLGCTFAAGGWGRARDAGRGPWKSWIHVPIAFQEVEEKWSHFAERAWQTGKWGGEESPAQGCWAMQTGAELEPKTLDQGCHWLG